MVEAELKAMNEKTDGSAEVKRKRLWDILAERIKNRQHIPESLTRHIVTALAPISVTREATRLGVHPDSDTPITIPDLRMRLLIAIAPNSTIKTKRTRSSSMTLPNPPKVEEVKQTPNPSHASNNALTHRTENSKEDIKTTKTPKIPEATNREKCPKKKPSKPAAPSTITAGNNPCDTAKAVKPVEPKKTTKGQDEALTSKITVTVSKNFIVQAIEKLDMKFVNYELTTNGIEPTGESASDRRKTLLEHLTDKSTSVPDTLADGQQAGFNTTQVLGLEKALMKIQDELSDQGRCLNLILKETPKESKTLLNIEREVQSLSKHMKDQQLPPLQQPPRTYATVVEKQASTPTTPARTVEKEEKYKEKKETSSLDYSTISSEALEQTRDQRDTRIYSHRPDTRKCLLIHDSHHDRFNERYFDKSYLVVRHKAVSVKKIHADPSIITNALKTADPEATVVHLGFNDLTRNQSLGDYTDRMEDLIWNVMDNSSSNLVINPIIETRNNIGLNKVIKAANNEILRLISYLRREHPALRKRLFSFDNRTLHRNNFYDEDGVHLNVDGNRKLMLRLRDAFEKALRLPIPEGRYETSRESYHRQGPAEYWYDEC